MTTGWVWTVSLPILTFDEHVLSPRFGYVFHPRWLDPYESIVGMLWKFVRVNRLAGHMVVMQLSRQPIDPYAGIEPCDVDVRGVARLLRVTQRSVRSGVARPGVAGTQCLRFCPRCVALGYHGAAHQIERFGRCPAHDCPIETVCRQCGRTSGFRLDAQLLDAPFRCRHCRRYYTTNGFAPRLGHPALSLKERIAFTRAAIA